MLYSSTDIIITQLFLQKIFGEFVTVEMAFHAKALEVYTTAYQHIKNVDEEAHLEVFQPCMDFFSVLSYLRIIVHGEVFAVNLQWIEMRCTLS